MNDKDTPEINEITSEPYQYNPQERRDISRRRFINMGVGVIAGVTAAGIGLNALSNSQKELSFDSTERYPTYEGINRVRRILISNSSETKPIKEQLEKIGQRRSFQVVGINCYLPWLQDYGISMSDGSVSVYNGEYVDDILGEFFTESGKQKNLMFGSYLDLNIGKDFNFMIDALKDASIKVKEVPIWIEGGNQLFTKDKNGDNSLLIGSNTVEANRLLLSRQIGKDKSLISDDEVLEWIGHVQNLPRTQIFTVDNSNFGYHIDLSIRPFSNGQLIVRNSMAIGFSDSPEKQIQSIRSSSLGNKFDIINGYEYRGGLCIANSLIGSDFIMVSNEIPVFKRDLFSDEYKTKIESEKKLLSDFLKTNGINLDVEVIETIPYVKRSGYIDCLTLHH